MAKIANMALVAIEESGMKSMSAKDAKNGFGLLIDTARAEPVTIEKHGRGVVVVLAIEEYVRLTKQTFVGGEGLVSQNKKQKSGFRRPANSDGVP